ncbi:MAG: hypothetical protein PHV42_02055, partial [Candidatus Pacebacteria bacterium]|nr:hypothetical protein [Candidatus Paceibacterota bacterium]
RPSTMRWPASTFGAKEKKPRNSRKKINIPFFLSKIFLKIIILIVSEKKMSLSTSEGDFI